MPTPLPAAPADALVFPFAMRAVTRRLLPHGLLALGLWTLLALFAHSDRSAAVPYVAPLLAYSLLIGCWVLISVRNRRQTAALSLSTDDLFLPTFARWNGVRRVPLLRIERIRLMGNASGHASEHTLMLNLASAWPVVLPVHAFASEDDARRFADALALRTRLRTELTQGRSLTRLSLVIVGVLILVQVAYSAFAADQPFALLNWGGLHRVLVYEGQWFRLVTAALLQADPAHLVINVALLLLLLPDLQRLMGSASVVLLMLLASLFGAAAALAVAPQMVAVGASAGVYGLLGAAIWLRFTDRKMAPAALADVPTLAWGCLLAVDLALTLISAQMTLASQLLGLLIGAGVTAALYTYRFPLRAYLPWLGLIALATVLVATAALLRNVAQPGASARIAGLLVNSRFSTLEDANYGAWSLAMDDAAAPADLQMAREGLQARVQQASDTTGAVRDTVATLMYRTGDAEQAVMLESALLEELGLPIFAMRLAQFERAAGASIIQIPVGLARKEQRICVVGGGEAPVDVDVLVLQQDVVVAMYRLSRMLQEGCMESPAGIAGKYTLTVSRTALSTSPGKPQLRFWSAQERTHWP